MDVFVFDFEGIGLIYLLNGFEGGNGEWDDICDFCVVDFVIDIEGMGFVYCVLFYGMEEFEFY